MMRFFRKKVLELPDVLCFIEIYVTLSLDRPPNKEYLCIDPITVPCHCENTHIARAKLISPKVHWPYYYIILYP